jgi:hypothetical protein
MVPYQVQFASAIAEKFSCLPTGGSSLENSTFTVAAVQRELLTIKLHAILA